MRSLLFALLAVAATALQAAEIKVVSAAALKPVLDELVPQFEKSSGHKVKAEFVSAAEIAARVGKREAFDVAIVTPQLMDQLAKNKRIADGSRAGVARAKGGESLQAAGAADAREPQAALQFLRFLKTPEAAKVIRAKGMEPG